MDWYVPHSVYTVYRITRHYAQWYHVKPLNLVLKSWRVPNSRASKSTNKHLPITAADMTRNDKIAALLQKRQEHDIRELNKAVNEFRNTHQQPDGRREFDLNDPDSLKKDKPARVSDDDPRCGVASLQKFVGEDLNGKARQKIQQEQAR